MSGIYPNRGSVNHPHYFKVLLMVYIYVYTYAYVYIIYTITKLITQSSKFITIVKEKEIQSSLKSNVLK